MRLALWAHDRTARKTFRDAAGDRTSTFPARLVSHQTFEKPLLDGRIIVSIRILNQRGRQSVILGNPRVAFSLTEQPRTQLRCNGLRPAHIRSLLGFLQ